MALAPRDLGEIPEGARVEQELFLGLSLLRRAERDSMQATRKALDDRERLQRAERLAEERIGAGFERCFGRSAVRAAQDDDWDVFRLPVALQLPGEGQPVHSGEVDVEHERVRMLPPDRSQRGPRILCVLDLD